MRRLTTGIHHFALKPQGDLNESKFQNRFSSLDRVYQRAVNSGDIAAISDYAASSPEEFFAEAFTMWRNGEYLPGYIVKLIKEIVL